MKKILITMMLVLSSVLAFSQTDYTRIETDSLGKKVVVMTIEQAQKIDNNLEILQLMEKAQYSWNLYLIFSIFLNIF